MSFDGFLQLGGVELINAERTMAYVRNNAPGLPLRETPDTDNIHVALEQDEYRSPVLDDADWVSAADPSTHGFYGLYPLDITGIGDSTRVAVAQESIDDGGTVSDARHATREIRVHGILVGDNPLAAEAGLSWLRSVASASGCSLHDDSCGQSDLEYLLAAPTGICEYSFEPVANGSSSQAWTGSVTADTSPLVAEVAYKTDPEQLNQPGDQAFKFVPHDGQIVEWGALEVESSDVVKKYGPLVVQRTNLCFNPEFAVDTSGWTATTSTLSRSATGGIGNGSFGILTETAAPVQRENFAPDPFFVNPNPIDSGWRVFGATTAATQTAGAPTSRRMMVTLNAPDTAAIVEVSPLGPPAPVNSAISFWLAAGAGVSVSVFDASGNLVTTVPFVSGAAGRRSLTAVLSASHTVRFTSASSFSIADLLIEAGATVNPTSFSGGPASSGTNVYFWAGAPLTSISVFRAGAQTAHTLTFETPDSTYDPLWASFMLRSDNYATLTAKIVGDDGATLATRDLVAGKAWTANSIFAPLGRHVRLVISGTGSYQITRVLIENNSLLSDYYNGSSVIDGYTVSWLGQVGKSESRLLTTLYNVAQAAVRLEIKTEDSFIRAYMRVIAGTVFAPELRMYYHPRITVETQMLPLVRYYHDVSVTSGPTVIKRYPLARGYAIEIEMYLNAGTPFAFSGSTAILDSSTAVPAPVYFSDPRTTRRNLAHNPGGYLLSTLGAGSVNKGVNMTISNVTTSPLRATRTGTATGNAYFSIEADGLIASTSYRLRALINVVSGTDTGILATVRGDSVTTIYGSQAMVLTAGVWAVDFVFTTPSVVDNTSQILFDYQGASTGSVTQLGDVVLLEQSLTTASGAPFDGAKTDTTTRNYAWLGAAYNSASTETDVTGSIDLLADPSCPPLTQAPRPPVIVEDCVDDVLDWRRYFFEIPSDEVALWADIVPTITINSKTTAVQQLRVRFHPNPFDYPIAAIDPLAYCGEFILSYLPAATELTVNGMTQRAYASVSGSDSLSADSLLYGTGGGPMVWPEMSCGVGYVMTVDVPRAAALGNLSFGLTVNRRE